MDPEFKNNSYWFEGNGPYCTACWDIDKLKVRLHDVNNGWAQCPAGKGHPNVRAFPEKPDERFSFG